MTLDLDFRFREIVRRQHQVAERVKGGGGGDSLRVRKRLLLRGSEFCHLGDLGQINNYFEVRFSNI